MTEAHGPGEDPTPPDTRADATPVDDATVEIPAANTASDVIAGPALSPDDD